MAFPQGDHGGQRRGTRKRGFSGGPHRGQSGRQNKKPRLDPSSSRTRAVLTNRPTGDDSRSGRFGAQTFGKRGRSVRRGSSSGGSSPSRKFHTRSFSTSMRKQSPQTGAVGGFSAPEKKFGATQRLRRQRQQMKSEAPSYASEETPSEHETRSNAGGYKRTAKNEEVQAKSERISTRKGQGLRHQIGAQMDSETATVPTDGLSNSQLCKAIEWGLQQTRAKWWEVKQDLLESVEASVHKSDAEIEKFDSDEDALAALETRVSHYMARIKYHVPRQDEKDVDFAWATKLAHTGTLKDRFIALFQLCEKQPVFHLHNAQQLFGVIRLGKNRTEVLQAIEVAADLIASDFLLPGDKPLQAFSDEGSDARKTFLIAQGNHVFLNISGLDKDSPRLRLLLHVGFEHFLKKTIAALTREITRLGRDPIDHMRLRLTTFAYEWLATKCEQEEVILGTLVHAMGDMNGRVASKASRHVASLLHLHSAMKPAVCRAVEQLIWMQRIPLTALKERGQARLTRAETRTKRRLKMHAAMMRDLSSKATEGDSSAVDGDCSVKSKEGDGSNRVGASTRHAFQAVCNACVFLSEVQYSPTRDPPNFPTQMLKRYVRILMVMLRPTESLRRDFRRAIRHAQKARLQQRPVQPTGTVSYAHGLAYDDSAASILRHIFTGVRRLLPYLNEKMINDYLAKRQKKYDEIEPGTVKQAVKEEMQQSEREGSKAVSDTNKVKQRVKRALTPIQVHQAKREDAVATEVTAKSTSGIEIDIAAQLFSLVHKVESWPTRIAGWNLLYEVLKHTNRLSTTFCANFYAQMKQVEMLQAIRNREQITRFVCKLAEDSGIHINSRVALIRRLIQQIMLSNLDPGALLPVFDCLSEIRDEQVRRVLSGAPLPPSAVPVSQSVKVQQPYTATMFGDEANEIDEPVLKKARKAGGRQVVTEPSPRDTELTAKEATGKRQQAKRLKVEVEANNSGENPIEYDRAAFNPERSNAATSLMWELEYLAQSPFSLVRRGVEALKSVCAKFIPEDEQLPLESEWMKAVGFQGLLSAVYPESEMTSEKERSEVKLLGRQAMATATSLCTMAKLFHGHVSIRRALGLAGGEGESMTNEDEAAVEDLQSKYLLKKKTQVVDPMGFEQAATTPEDGDMDKEDMGDDLDDGRDGWAMKPSQRAVYQKLDYFPFHELMRSYYERAFAQGKFAKSDLTGAGDNESFDDDEIDNIIQADLGLGGDGDTESDGFSDDDDISEMEDNESVTGERGDDGSDLEGVTLLDPGNETDNMSKEESDSPGEESSTGESGDVGPFAGVDSVDDSGDED